MKTLLQSLDQWPIWQVLSIGILLVLGIGGIDYLTGDFSILVFYVVPIFIVAWRGGTWWGIVIAVASGTARFASDFPLYHDMLRHFWNPLADTVFLLVVSLLVSLLKKSLGK